MSTMIGSLNVQNPSAGYWFWIAENGPADWIAEVRGERVLIPGRDGMYTPPTDPFEPDRLRIVYHGWVFGAGSTHATAQASYVTLMAALKTACDVTGREDITLTEGGYTAQAGFLRMVGPSASLLGGEAREFDIEFEATDPPEWTAS